jgi:hypothetical protein
MNCFGTLIESCRGVKLTTHLHILPRFSTVELNVTVNEILMFSFHKMKENCK